MAITGRLRRSVVSRRSGERFVIPEPERQLFGGGLAFRGARAAARGAIAEGTIVARSKLGKVAGLEHLAVEVREGSSRA